MAVIREANTVTRRYTALLLTVNRLDGKKPGPLYRLMTLAEILFPAPIAVIRWALYEKVSWKLTLQQTAVAPWRLFMYLIGRTDACHLWEYKEPE